MNETNELDPHPSMVKLVLYTLELAKRIYPHIRTSTELALEFNDKYSEADEAQLLLLDDDLNELGPVLEERFKQEDRLVKALHVVESLSAQQA